MAPPHGSTSPLQGACGRSPAPCSRARRRQAPARRRRRASQSRTGWRAVARAGGECDRRARGLRAYGESARQEKGRGVCGGARARAPPLRGSRAPAWAAKAARAPLLPSAVTLLSGGACQRTPPQLLPAARSVSLRALRDPWQGEARPAAGLWRRRRRAGAGGTLAVAEEPSGNRRVPAEPTCHGYCGARHGA